MNEKTKESEVLGKILIDSISGFKGICTAFTIYLTGCNRVLLEGKEGVETKEAWFDIMRVNFKKKKFVYKKEKNVTGGYKSAPKKIGY